MLVPPARCQQSCGSPRNLDKPVSLGSGASGHMVVMERGPCGNGARGRAGGDVQPQVRS